jgi:hypothetical protein
MVIIIVVYKLVYSQNYYLQALSCDHPTVVLEVVLGMESLVMKLGATIQSTIWEKVLNILKCCAEFVSKYFIEKLLFLIWYSNILFKLFKF